MEPPTLPGSRGIILTFFGLMRLVDVKPPSVLTETFLIRVPAGSAQGPLMDLNPWTLLAQPLVHTMLTQTPVNVEPEMGLEKGFAKRMHPQLNIMKQTPPSETSPQTVEGMIWH